MRRLRIPADKADRKWQEDYRQQMGLLNQRGTGFGRQPAYLVASGG